LGNHEFDDGDAALAEFITILRNSTTCPDTSVLAANLVPGLIHHCWHFSRVAPFIRTLSISDQQVGVIGIDIRNKTLLSSSPDAGTTLLDERETATAQVAERLRWA
jgi:5'-nucleotidase